MVQIVNFTMMSDFDLRHVLLVVIGISISSVQSSYALSSNETLVCWDKHTKLQWNDYLGKPNAAHAVSAITVANIEVYPVYDKKERRSKYKISNTFNKHKSWVKQDNGAKVFSVLLLEHEQLHFDISELFSRKLRYEFHKIENAQKAQVKDAVYQKIIQDVMNERDALEETYDRETNHGRILKKQEEWQIRIEKELHKLDNYSSTSSDCKKN